MISERLRASLAERYRLERELGQGGMATVYLAEDLRHDRKVAVKVLKPELAAVLGADRFVQEIKTTAQLQHPHILPLFDSGSADGFLYYVMPYIEGETLRTRLDHDHQLGIDEAVKITSEVADALDYAHRHGVIHRDIKPENILLHDGRPMVADFGIALAVSAAAGGRMTETGLSLGTPHYMSPEQATAEKEITARSDVYSLASVLYEMLTGQPPHLGGSAQQIIMKIIAEEVEPVTRHRKAVPPNVAAAVARALEKLPADRFATAKEFAEALANPAFTQAVSPSARVAVRRANRPATLLGAAAVLLTGIAAWGWLRPAPRQPVVRYSMGMPTGQAMLQGQLGVNLAFSPDGSRIVYVGPGEHFPQLWVRERDQLEAKPLSGTDKALNPFFSPDGARIGFSTVIPAELKVVPVSGGPPITLAAPGAGSTGGGVWGADGWIYFDTQGGLSRIRPDGGTPELVVPYDTAAHEIGYAWPDVLPNGRGLIYRSRRNLDPNTFDLVAFDLRSRRRHVLMKGLMARYVAPGYLVYLRADGAVLAVPFDQDRLAVTGAPVLLLDGVMIKPFGSADFAISRAGTLAYVPGQAEANGIAEVILADRDSSAHPLSPPLIFDPSATAPSLSLSPDGSRLALDIAGATSTDLWVKQLPSGPLSRLTFTGNYSGRPRWTPDGQSVIYVAIANDTARPLLWRRRADGSSPPEPVLDVAGKGVIEGSYSRDGRWLIYVLSDTAGRTDIFARHTSGDTTPVPLLTGPAAEQGAALSPDGRWLAYQSDESGRDQVYVVPFPATRSGRWQVSTDGGSAARWSHTGSSLFFENTGGELMEVPVLPGATFTPGAAQRILPAVRPSIGVPYYDLTPDDRRFVRVRPVQLKQAPGGSRIVMVEHWTDELRDRMRGRR